MDRAELFAIVTVISALWLLVSLIRMGWRRQRRSASLQALISALVLVGSAVYGSSSPTLVADPTPDVSAVSQPPNEEPTSCREDISCWTKATANDALLKCSKGIERTAQYQFEWTAGLGSGPRFDEPVWKSKKSGVVRYSGDRIRMQNGFGAWQTVSYDCDFDPATRSVVNLEIR